ncbi:MAG: GAF and ANTAR domain-containing protein [Miltoncostaeaceae bacterium]
MTGREQRLAQTLVELTDTLMGEFDVVELLTVLAERSVELFDAAAAGVLLADGDGLLQLVAATSEAAETVELFQVQGREGPCNDCYRSGQPVLVEDLAGATGRWPAFVPVATKAGFRSAQALPLRLRHEVLGAFNLFRAGPGRMDARDTAAAQALADAATLGIIHHRAIADSRALAEHLQIALDSRVAIEQAKGILAARAGVGVDDAFSRLRAYARRNGLRLSAVAEDIVAGRLGPDAVLVLSA